MPQHHNDLMNKKKKPNLWEKAKGKQKLRIK